jgi:hypothetical protein
MTEEQKQQLAGLAFDCARAVLEGRDTITVSKIGPKRLPGFPRGELLSVGTNGAHNYAVCPLRVLAWIHSGAKGGRLVDEGKTPNVGNEPTHTARDHFPESRK